MSSKKMKKTQKLSPTAEIVFSGSDLERVIPGHDNSIIISVVMVNAKVKKVFMDQGSVADIIFRDAFNKLGLKNSDLQSYKEELISFSRENVNLDGFITLDPRNLTLDQDG